MDWGNQSKTIVYNLLIGGMTCLGHHDGFPMMNSLVYMTTHYIGFTINHDISYWVVMIH